MCGITGIYRLDGKIVDQNVLENMTNMLAHRGPDGHGIWINNSIGLGHRRLAIIDLSKEANQPMHSSDNKLHIVFNGEIYNYKELRRLLISRKITLRTNSDTEVILFLYKLFKEECVNYLRGMFAFAIWDDAEYKLFIARDRVGIKPLYYMYSEDKFVFASEIKAVLASGYSSKRLDINAFQFYSRFLTYCQPDTVIKDIKKLEPAHYLTVTTKGVIIKEYWNIKKHIGIHNTINEKAAIDQLEYELQESIKYHMVSDVPVSAFLSGGLDSSAVLALMQKLKPDRPITAYSIVFPFNEKFNEEHYADIVCKHLKTLHIKKEFTPNFIEDFDKICWYLDEPFAVSSAYATYYLSQLVAGETKVVLTGDGGDELFAGYEGYKNNTYLNHNLITNHLFNSLFPISILLYDKIPGRNDVLDRLLSGLSRRIGHNGIRFSNLLSQSGIFELGNILNKDYYMLSLKGWKDNLIGYYYNECSNIDLLSKKLYSTFKTRLVDEMLMKVDRMTMAHSLEARVPLLDHKLVEFAFGLPSTFKLKIEQGKTESKYLIKKAMQKYLPEEIIFRQKKGFNIPQFLLHKENIELVLDKINDGKLVKSGIIRRNSGTLLQNLIKKGFNSYNTLVVLFAFETWYDQYKNHFGEFDF